MYKFFNYYNSLCLGANSPTVFSFDPYIAAIKEILVSELREIVFYIVKLKKFNIDMNQYRDKVIEFISVLVVNLDFRRESFFVIVEDLNENKIKLQNLYNSMCKEQGISPELIEIHSYNLSNRESILKVLNEHEKNISELNNTLSANKKNLYEILVHLVLNACNCLIELKNYGFDYSEAKDEVLKLFNVSNSPTDDEFLWKEKILDFSKCNYQIMKKLNEVIIEKFGPVKQMSVPFKIKKGKAILVSDSSFSDLKRILDAVEPYNINVYTHHEMITAFQYKKLSSYKKLVGHYQRSNNNFPLDFYSFSGPIYISKNSIPKIDVIRGQIYTSAKYPAFGFSKIEDNDFSELINYALASEGFSEDAIINSISIGYDIDIINEKINNLIKMYKNNEFSHIFIIGVVDKFAVPNNYIKAFIDNIPENSFVVSFTDIPNIKNSITVSSYYDFYLLYIILEKLINVVDNPSKNISLFLPDCSINVISHLFNLMYLGIKKIFLGPCCPNIMNPLLIDALQTMFDINELTLPSKDIKTALQ